MPHRRRANEGDDIPEAEEDWWTWTDDELYIIERSPGDPILGSEAATIRPQTATGR